ncbi:MAG: acetyl-CoA carboxylase carboxyltransferase subunit alpha [Armatimonadetes bacterium]|nr:acetyl-CoA carboxylase carboxyltransferase subunit alpha [Armatimonadota bacterium]NIM24639.1 acetyl-CoA carboxylase carboxyltransferase subunit alpha [Armatimonadota bacterium]NIM68518.1 acetyl-CoA carboxylase carboxyltransferase subunit alpha [Armatimonadota bacterium]NIM76900.1 acetyl-CoA carboxylase carboxyltransferase subunit alpha [Armatimonadota bacterium]NIN06712.1 acetyl-CoA carboxylase carboxyltransferase subunit alpha [Armatimonadota bacterium]
MNRWLPFEEPLRELEEQIVELERYTAAKGMNRSREIAALRTRQEELTREIFSRLSPWDNVQLARHPERPYALDYVSAVLADFVEIHGDRRFGDDPAVIAGMGLLEERPVVVVGHQKGRDLKERQARNFGSARPEGYRKALRAMKLGEKLGYPVISFVDTPAADSRPESEERGICESIGRNLAEMSTLRTPVLVVIIGEGGSGGAIALALGDWIMMLEHSVYSVIPPESCAVILSAFDRDASRGPEAAAALRLSARQTQELGVVDEVLDEPLGGAHRNPDAMASIIKETLIERLDGLCQLDTEELLQRRYEKFRRIGSFGT